MQRPRYSEGQDPTHDEPIGALPIYLHGSKDTIAFVLLKPNHKPLGFPVGDESPFQFLSQLAWDKWPRQRRPLLHPEERKRLSGHARTCPPKGACLSPHQSTVL